MMKQKWLSIALFLPCALAAAGCKQGLGERCEIDADCASGFCSRATPRVCAVTQEPGGIDATLPIDAAPGTDAASDAVAPPPDAAAIDAP